MHACWLVRIWNPRSYCWWPGGGHDAQYMCRAGYAQVQGGGTVPDNHGLGREREQRKEPRPERQEQSDY